MRGRRWQRGEMEKRQTRIVKGKEEGKKELEKGEGKERGSGEKWEALQS